MVWPMIAMAAVSAASSMMGQRNAGKIEAARTESENRIAAAKAEAENRMRPAQNALVAAQASLQRWAQSVNNNAMLDAAAAQHEANAVNSLRAEDAALEMDFDAGIAAAEEAGAQSAAAATMGLMGGVVDTINMTSALRRNRGKQSAMDAKDMREFDQRTRASGIMEQTWRGLDGSAIFENMDYGESIATRSLSGHQGTPAGRRRAGEGDQEPDGSGRPARR